MAGAAAVGAAGAAAVGAGVDAVGAAVAVAGACGVARARPLRRHDGLWSRSMGGGAKVVVEPHRHKGVFIARGKEDAIATRNLIPGKAVYGEKLIKIDEAEGVKASAWRPLPCS